MYFVRFGLKIYRKVDLQEKGWLSLIKTALQTVFVKGKKRLPLKKVDGFRACISVRNINLHRSVTQSHIPLVDFAPSQ